jgi:DNA-directed RNA polymerase specialized sigma24 family protein
MCQLTRAAFEAYVPAIRPQLLATAKSLLQNLDDAEDVVQNALLTALGILDRYETDTTEKQSPYPKSLAGWLVRITRFECLDAREQRERRRTVAIEKAAALPAPCVACSIREMVEPLPDKFRGMVADWLNGETQVDIATAHRVSRNTVGNRLTQAFELLRREVPDGDRLQWDSGLFYSCARVSVYKRPTGVWRSWFAQLPPDVRFGAPCGCGRRQNRHEAGY